MAENLFFENLFSGLNLKPKMLDQYPDQNSFMEYAKQKLADAYATGSADKVEAVDKALAGRLRNYQLLSEYENERQAVLNRARQYGQERKERERAAYEQENAERLANFKGLMAGPITNVREVGPAGYQPGYQGGMDFASLQDMVPPPPDNKYAKSLLDGLNQGSQKAKEQNRTSTLGFFSDAREGVSSLFGDIGSGLGDVLTSPFVKRLLAIMARPEFQSTEGISAGIVNAAYGLAQDEAKAAEKAMQQQRLDNEAIRQAFFDKLRIEEAERAERREERAEQKAGETKYRILTANQETKLISRAKQIKEVADFVDANSATLYGRNILRKDLPSSTDLYVDLVRTATEKMDEEKIPFDKAIRMLVREMQQPSTTSKVPQKQQNVDPAGTVKKPR